MMGKLVSIIIPAYNAEAYLVKRAEEIAEGAACPGILKPRDVEVVIVNDGSTDGTFDEMVNTGIILRHHGFGWFGHSFRENGGTFAAEEMGLRCASGKYVYFQDQDDPFHPHLLHELLESRVAVPPDIHIAAPTMLIANEKVTGELWQSETGTAIDALYKQFKARHGIINRRSLFRRDVLMRAYTELALAFAEAGIGPINAVQDSVVITYLLGCGVFTSIVESKAAYWWTCDNPGSMSRDEPRRQHDLAVLHAVTAYAIDRLEVHIAIPDLSHYLSLVDKEAVAP